MILCDTDVIIEFYKGNARIIDELKRIQESNIVISVISASELVYGALDKRDLKQILKDVDNLHVLPLTEDISRIQFELLATYSLSHNLKLPDALIAATAISNAIQLFTLNLKDFRYIESLELYNML